MNGTAVTRDDDEDGPAFARWCIRACVARLKRRLGAGLPISEIGWRTLRRFGGLGPMTVTFVEHANAAGERWARALDLLLEAGRGTIA